MKKMITSIALASTMALAGGSYAQITEVTEVTEAPYTGFYAGGSVTANQTYLAGNADWFKTSNLNKTAYGIGLDAGYTFFNNGDFAVSAEGRYGLSLAGDDFVETSYVAGYLKPEVIFNGWSAYGLFGYGQVTYTETVDAHLVKYSTTADVDGFTWGLGGSYAINSNVSVFADYVVQPTLDLVDIYGNGAISISEDNIETDVISVGVNYRW